MHHPTIRSIAGAAAPTGIVAAHTALLVIDFQNEYFSGRMPIPDGLAALRNARRLITFADRQRMPVFHVQHVRGAGAPIFAEDSVMADFHAELQPAPQHHVVRKTEVSVFQRTDIDARLKAAGITTLIICGLMTHACVSGATRDAVPLGYGVIVAADACATRDIDGTDGAPVPHALLHRASLVTLADAFADVMHTGRIVELALA